METLRIKTDLTAEEEAVAVEAAEEVIRRVFLGERRGGQGSGGPTGIEQLRRTANLLQGYAADAERGAATIPGEG